VISGEYESELFLITINEAQVDKSTRILPERWEKITASRKKIFLMINLKLFSFFIIKVILKKMSELHFQSNFR